jgi:hypoxanthine phosphoribosyltransferase
LVPVFRGGLAFALALSHKFSIPIVHRPSEASLFVDDIADSGETYQKLQRIYGNIPMVVLLKRDTLQNDRIETIDTFSDDWVVFPWENKAKVVQDYEQYRTRKRNL